MALPVDGLATSKPITAPFIPPRDRSKAPLEQWERGGVGLNDATRGLNVYDWRFWAHDTTGEVRVGVPGIVADTVIYTIDPLPITLSGSFDTNMQPIIAWWNIYGEAFFRWFDPVASAFVNVALPLGATDLQLALDDVRDAQALAGVTDTILAYMRDGALCYRQLRDRFEVEHEIADDLEDYVLLQIGMNRARRFQFQLVHRPRI